MIQKVIATLTRIKATGKPAGLPFADNALHTSAGGKGSTKGRERSVLSNGL
jgi:hypothetical protein